MKQVKQNTPVIVPAEEFLRIPCIVGDLLLTSNYCGEFTAIDLTDFDNQTDDQDLDGYLDLYNYLYK